MITTTVLILLALLAASIPIAAAVGLLGVAMSWLYSPMPLLRSSGELAWGAASEPIVVAVPLFILMGEILLRSGVAGRMYEAMVQWLSWLPGGLMHSNIGACTFFAASSGSSAATAATISTVSIPEMEKNEYKRSIFLGSLAAGGTLGILIPPSINLVVYGVLTETSIPKLYLAGFLPGALLAATFIAIILVACLLRPSWGGRKITTSWPERIRCLPALVPPMLIFLVVIGSIYAGIATPTESASIGVTASLVLAATHRSLSLPVLRTAIEGTLRTAAMILLIFMTAFFLNFVISSTGLTQRINSLIVDAGMSPLQTLIVIVVFYLILGCFMETMAMMITTVPVITPVVESMGYNPIWFGVIIILLVETAMITPPVGVNLYIVQGVRRSGSLHEIMFGVAPFFIGLILLIALIIAFPEIALWLPSQWNP